MSTLVLILPSEQNIKTRLCSITYGFCNANLELSINKIETKLIQKGFLDGSFIFLCFQF